MSSSRGSSQPRDRNCISSIAGRFFTTEPPGKARGRPETDLPTLQGAHVPLPGPGPGKDEATGLLRGGGSDG